MPLKYHFFEGMSDGLFTPYLKFEIPDLDLQPNNLDEILSCLKLDIDTCFSDNKVADLNIADALLAILMEIRNSFECGLFNSGKILESSSNVFELLIPCLKTDSGRLIAIAEIVFSCLVNKKDSSVFRESLRTLKSNSKLISRKTFNTSNTSRFLISAQELGCPFRVLERDFILFGLGYFGVIFNSSFTQKTSWVGNSLAKDKLLCSTYLSAALFPTTKGSEVDGIDDLIAKANKIGYPVVIKPRALDGGAGVFPNLANQKQLEFAYSQASKLTKDIIIERFFRSNDYRIVVYEDEVIWAIERRYPGIIGDGENTILQLIEIENRSRAIDSTKSSVLSPLAIDTETVICLRNQGLELDSIPEPNNFVRVRDKSNINVGGVPISFPLDNIHEDNISLAREVVNAIGLNLAGVDLLIDDLSKSWREIGGVICEINAQPSLGYLTSKHLYGDILQKELSKGFSPKLTICPLNISIDKLIRLSKSLYKDDLECALIYDKTAYIGLEKLTFENMNCFELIEGLFKRKTVRNILVSDDFDFRLTGLPCMNSINFLIPSDFLQRSQEESIHLLEQVQHFLAYVEHIFIPTQHFNEIKYVIQNSGVDMSNVALISLEDL
jgi:cyanophycin synthetase